mgnify:CR=1 FL=1
MRVYAICLLFCLSFWGCDSESVLSDSLGAGGNEAGTAGEAGSAGQVGLDLDNDGFENAQDNCQNESNPDQTDTDGDGIGDVCDANPLRADLILRGEFVLLGGDSVNDTHSLRARVITGQSSSQNQNFILRGGISP